MPEPPLAETSGIPPFPRDTVVVLSTVDGDGPSLMPLTAAHRLDHRRVLCGLAPTRSTLARLRRRPDCALLVLARDVAVTARGSARVVVDPMPVTGLVAVLVTVHRAWDPRNAATIVSDGVRWGWADAGSAARHEAVLAELAELAEANSDSW
ncbi:MAG: pyridoxamine 5'-phosphate oxidase family protein [Thermoleophilia bacterium]